MARGGVARNQAELSVAKIATIGCLPPCGAVIKPDKVQTALSEGNLARAREILSGRLKSAAFGVSLYEQFGVVLLRMGDLSEAGKYLFLSGVRRPEYDEAIVLFVRRYSRAGWQYLVQSFPRRVKRGTWAALPRNVRAELQAAGVPPQNDSQYIFKTLQAYAGRQLSGWQWLRLGLAILLAGLIVSVVVAYLHVLAEGG